MIRSGHIKKREKKGKADKMSFVEKNILLNREKKLKSKLVNTRQIIKNKFRKVRRNRVKREHDLNEKYKPITKAISKLDEGFEKPLKLNDVHQSDDSNSSDDELAWDYDMDYDDLSHYSEPMRHKIHRVRDDDSVKVSKKSRPGHPKGLKELSKELKRRLKERNRLRKIRAESKLKRVTPSKKLSDIQSKTVQVRSNESAYDKSDTDSDTLVQSNESRKRLRLERSALNMKDDLITKKNNRKILEMRKVDNIMMGVKNKTIADSLEKRDKIIDISSDSDVELAASVDKNTVVAHKKSTYGKADKSKTRVLTPYEKKADMFKRIASRKYHPMVVHARQNSGKKTDVVADLLENENDEVVSRPNRTKKAIRKDKNERKEQKEKKKDGGCIEFDFIPYNENIVHEFYDDPNELCERLHLLIASRAAGNSNHMQEINSIITELREADVIF